jgi:hypothetical protein
MPDLDVLQPAPNVRLGLCRRLHWKALFTDVPPDEHGETGLYDDGCVWCTRTMTCLGPDAKAASKGECRAGRGCFEP